MLAEAFTTTRYRCAFCRRSWSSRTRANEHVRTCWKNPDQRSCKTCKHHLEAEPYGYEEPGADEWCEVTSEFVVGPAGTSLDGSEPLFRNRDGAPRFIKQMAEEGWWPQRHCPLWASVSAPEETDR